MGGSPIYSHDTNRHTCTVTGAVWGYQGRTFTGDDKIVVPDHAALNIGTEDFSVGGWCNLTTDVTDYRQIMAKQYVNVPAGYYAGWQFRFNITTGYLLGNIDERLNDGTHYLELADTTNHLNTGWHMYFMTVDRDSATGMKLWVDTTNVKTGNPTAVVSSLSNTQSLYIGIDRSNTQFFFKGGMGELFLYKGKALNQLGISNLYEETKGRGK